MTVELTQLEGIIRYYPLVCDFLLYLLSILANMYRSCPATGCRLAAAVLGVAIISLSHIIEGTACEIPWYIVG